jgi:glycosyltransferase involved in cell wall biosynthesis
MNYPKISIVTPSFNQGNFLEKTIISITSQNYPNLEYIVMDGGSSDNSVEIIKKYSDKIKFWVSEKDNGMYHAIQRGFENSSGEIMAYLNSDDIYFPEALHVVAEIFQSFPEISWLTSNNTCIDEAGRIVQNYTLPPWSKFKIYKKKYKWIQQESTFWRRNLWEKAGSELNLNLKLAADFDLWLRFFRYEKLYTFRGILGGFRYRKANQKSLEGGEAYTRELESLIEKEALNAQDNFILKKILNYENIIFRLPLIRNSSFLKKSYINLFNYPPVVEFSREAYKFRLSPPDIRI